MSLLAALPRVLRRSAPPVAPVPGWYRREAAIMGTAISAELWADSPAEGEAALDVVFDEMHRIDRLMSPHKPASELSRINREAAHHAVPLREEMATLLARALDFSARTDGAFDISFAAIGQLYDYRAGTVPSPQLLAAARGLVDWRELHLDRRAGTLRFGRAGMRIDLGGIAKGHAVDRAVALLRQRGIQHAMVAAGGDSHLLGDRRGRPWQLGIAHPRRKGDTVAVLPLQDTAVSTSGDYERGFERRGVRHHHLIDPRTGDSARGATSVTVLAPDGVTAEALSKMLFIHGPRRGFAMLEDWPGVDAVLVDAQGVLHASAGFNGSHS
ncbi:FAD:protein FMN transferase [Ideonella alba]|nr:FAD:protein FMN transferase [Ideonella alba]